MKIIRCEQGSGEWFDVRKGIPSASCFDQIITPKKREYSKQARHYAYRLIAERLLNMPLESAEASEWMTRGREKEPLAVKHYEFTQEVETEKVGFITTDDGLIGCSPDRLIKGKPACLECKAPAPQTQIAYLLEGHNDAYTCQLMGQLYVTEFDYVDFHSWHERMPACSLRVRRDEAFIIDLHNALVRFNDDMAAMTRRALSLGVFQAMAEAKTPLEIERAEEISDRYVGEEFGLPPIEKE